MHPQSSSKSNCLLQGCFTSLANSPGIHSILTYNPRYRAEIHTLTHTHYSQSLSKALPVKAEQPSEGEEEEAEADMNDEEREEKQSTTSEAGAALAQKLQKQLVITSGW